MIIEKYKVNFYKKKILIKKYNLVGIVKSGVLNKIMILFVEI